MCTNHSGIPKRKTFSYNYVQILQVIIILGIIRRLIKLLMGSVCGFRTEKYWRLCMLMEVQNYALKTLINIGLSNVTFIITNKIKAIGTRTPLSSSVCFT
jgi:hypothetical protein